MTANTAQARAIICSCCQKIREAILNKSKAQVLSFLSVVLLLTFPLFAKEDPHDLLTKSFQQADLWTQGPVKIDTAVRLPKPDGTDINVEYTISWAGPDKWRSEWAAQGLQYMSVVN